MTKIPQLISSTEVANKLGISKKTLFKLGFTKYKLNARIIRYSEREITLWLEKRSATKESNFNMVESCTQQPFKPIRKPRDSSRMSLKNGNIDVSALLKNVRFLKL